jgi:hypothetical protein
MSLFLNVLGVYSACACRHAPHLDKGARIQVAQVRRLDGCKELHRHNVRSSAVGLDASGRSRRSSRAAGSGPGNEVLMRGFLWLVMVLGLAGCVSGCHNESFPPLARVPFDASKVGRSVTIPIIVTRANANIDHAYMVGFYFRDESKGGPAEQMRGYPPKVKLYLRVHVFHETEGGEIPIVVNDGDFTYDIGTGKFSFPSPMHERGTDIAYVSSSGHLKGVAHREVVSFRFPNYGRYRVEISTVSDMPILEAIPTWLTVEREFPHGK